MWLVLEGINGAGKTTLAKALAKTHPEYRVLHVGPPVKNKSQFKTNTPVDLNGGFESLAHAWSTLDNPHLIFDRGHLGNLVYQEGEDRMTVPQLRVLEALLMNHNTLSVVLQVTPTDAARRIAEREGRDPDDKLVMNGDVGRLYQEHIRFQQACRELKSYWLTGNVQTVTVAFDDWQKYDDRRHVDYAGVGTTRPNLWLLGEQLNPRAELQVPFSTPAGMALIWPWVNPMYMRVSNALGSTHDLQRARQGLHDQEVLDHLYLRWVSLDKPRVVTFGRVAREVCVGAGVKVSLMLDHPQHVWRFRRAEAEMWRDRVAMKVAHVA